MSVDPITSGILFKAVEEIGKTIISSNERESEKTKNVVIVKNPDSYSLTLLDRAETIQQKINKKPNLSFENPLGTADSIIHEISLIPTLLNKEKIACIVSIGDVPIFKGKVGSFTDISDTIIRIQNGKRIRNGKSIDVFFWNGIDDTTIGLTAQVTFGE